MPPRVIRPPHRVRRYNPLMFDQIRGMGKLASMLGNPGQMQEMREQVERMQRELAARTVQGEAGAGAARATVNGKLELTRLELDPVMIGALTGDGGEAAAAADREMVEELVVSAVNAAMEKAKEMVKDEMSKLSGGLNLPGLDGIIKGLG